WEMRMADDGGKMPQDDMTLEDAIPLKDEITLPDGDCEVPMHESTSGPGMRKSSRLQELLAKLPLPGAEDAIPSGGDSSVAKIDDVDLLQLHMGGRDFLLAAKDVAEVVRPMPLTPVPMAPDHLLGVGNVHGQIVCVVEPGRMMSLPLPAAGDSDATRFVMLRHARMRVALRVDGVPAIHRMQETELQKIELADHAVHGVLGWLQVEGVRYDMLDAKALMQE
ncbi:MAG: chemotaxis protein CheW, partial [Mariprofundaceae bacterium]|nr:chemotaxis protein CheW [Mariprofundaceae bacterium]